MLDVTSYEAYIDEIGITRGIIVADKGFPSSAAEQQFRDHSDLHYLNLLKRNSKLIERHHMLNFTGILGGFEWITFRKKKCSGVSKWLYSFRDSIKAAREECSWLRRINKDQTYSLKK